jgi:hypothetical protein
MADRSVDAAIRERRKRIAALIDAEAPTPAGHVVRRGLLTIEGACLILSKRA